MAKDSPARPRLLPEKAFPAYAYLPGNKPHPVRDPAGHSYQTEPMNVGDEDPLSSVLFRWGIDLFNHGYYWEAHEAWEPLWRIADRGAGRRALFKGLILLAAAGVKIREGKLVAAARHSGRAAALFRQVAKAQNRPIETALGISPSALAEHAVAPAWASTACSASGQPVPVFDFILGWEPNE